jgi:metallo-beta-lactamase class B
LHYLSERKRKIYSQFQLYLVAVLLFIFVATTASIARQTDKAPNQWVVSDSLAVEMIHKGIWVHTSIKKLSNGMVFPGNGMIVQDGEELILIDTAWGVEHTRNLLDWIDAELSLRVTKAIITHFHDDSMGGTPVLKERGIPFFAHPLTIELAEDRDLPLPQPIDNLNAGEGITLSNIKVFYPGPGHSKDNLVVWVPYGKVIFGGCAVRSPEFPGQGNIADADIEHWPKAIRSVLQKYPDVQIVVPGHGKTGDVSLLLHTINLFAD